MARPLRIQYDGAVYHVTIRGNERKNIFRSQADRERFVNKLSESVGLYDVRLFLFTLMRNHHLVLETPRGNLSAFMHRLQTAYTVYFNRRHSRHGHLFQGRFGATLVEADEYILKLSRYVHLNPVFVKEYAEKSRRERVAVLREYEWSSYRGYVGLSERLAFVDYGPVLEMMSKTQKKQAASYRRFVEGGIHQIDAAFIEAKQEARYCLGSEAFVERVEALYESGIDAHAHPDDVSFRQERAKHSVDDVLGVCLNVLKASRETLQQRSKNSLHRPLAAYALCRFAGCSQREAASVLGNCSGAAVSLQLKKVQEMLQTNKDVQKTVRLIENSLK